MLRYIFDMLACQQTRENKTFWGFFFSPNDLVLHKSMM